MVCLHYPSTLIFRMLKSRSNHKVNSPQIFPDDCDLLHPLLNLGNGNKPATYNTRLNRATISG
jgi:hypothetical protein